MNREKLEEMLTRLKIEDEVQRAKRNKILRTVLLVLGALAVAGALAYAVYRFFTPEYLEDFEDDFDDDFDDYFEDEDYDEVLASSDKAAKDVEKKSEDGEE